MCTSLWMYPLVKFKDDTQKVLFDYGICCKDRQEFNHLNTFQHEVKLARLVGSRFKSLETLVNKSNFKELVKFVNIPCGCCSECLKQRSRDWAVRILEEAKQYKNNYFITLTYNDDYLPFDRNLVKDEISKFNKKLKIYLERNGLPSDFRFYGVGEYGSKTARPHYHVIYFNLEINDLKFYKVGDSGELYFTSEFLEKVWSKGFVVVGSVDVGSASYVARYCDKKRLLNKDQRQALINKGIVPEFSVMSRRPGIGANYLDVVMDNLRKGIYTISIKDSKYSISRFYSDKIKNLMDGTPELDAYLENKKLNQDTKIFNDILVSDYITDIAHLKVQEDKDKLKLKKKRLF